MNVGRRHLPEIITLKMRNAIGLHLSSTTLDSIVTGVVDIKLSKSHCGSSAV